MKKLFIFAILLFALFIPVITKAAGLVPCGGPDENPCTACDLLVLFQNVLKFALEIAFLIVIGFIAYGGFRWIFSGGNEANIKAGQKTLSSALVGLVIILCAWLIVNTVFWLIKTIGGDDYTGTWFKIECTYPETNTNNGGIGDSCRLNNNYDCHTADNCESVPIDHADCPEGWECCIGAGKIDPLLPTTTTIPGAYCRLKVGFDCHKAENCEGLFKIDHAGCLEGWECCDCAGCIDPLLPTTTSLCDAPECNDCHYVTGTCSKKICKCPCSDPHCETLQCLNETYFVNVCRENLGDPCPIINECDNLCN